MQNSKPKGPLYFVTEQACCLAQASGRETDDFHACQEAAEYLAGGNEAAMTDFRTRTSAVKLDPGADYDTEHYEDKDNDVREAVSALVSLGTSDATPEEKRGAILNAADCIAAFYGMGCVLEAASA